MAQTGEAHLPWVMLNLRAPPEEDSAISYIEMVYGSLLVLSGQFLEAKEMTSEPLVKSSAGSKFT